MRPNSRRRRCPRGNVTSTSARDSNTVAGTVSGKPFGDGAVVYRTHPAGSDLAATYTGFSKGGTVRGTTLVTATPQPDGTTTHRRSRPYLRRDRVRPGMAVRGGPLVRSFRKAGWRWGGRWSGAKDLQHFSSSGR